MNARALKIAKNFLNSWELPDMISVRYIDHFSQDYETAGDYFESGNEWISQISRMPDWRHSFALTMHELTEMALTKNNEIDWEAITKFDKDHPELEDPGRDQRAPYHDEHMKAEQVEKLIIKLLGLDWSEYQKEFEKL